MEKSSRPEPSVCLVCGALTYPRKDRVVKYCSRQCAGVARKGTQAYNKGKPMSFEAKAKLSLKLKGRPPSSTSFKKGEHVGEKNPQWHGGKWHTAQGYRLILQPGHLRANGRGYVMESILVAEECLGRALTKDETLHHINENRTDNSPENLYLFPSQADHKRYHMNVRHGKVPRIEKSNLK